MKVYQSTSIGYASIPSRYPWVQSGNGFSHYNNSPVRSDQVLQLLFFLETIRMSATIAKQNALEPPRQRILSSGEILLKAKQILGTSIAELSELLGVSRPTVYSYLSGNEPIGNADSLHQRLTMLLVTIDTVIAYELPIPAVTLLKRRDTEGRMFKELLVSEQLDDHTIQAFCVAEKQMLDSMQERSLMRRKTTQGNRTNNNEAISVPAFLE